MPSAATIQQRKETLSFTVAQRQKIRNEARDYMNRTGLGVADMAHRIQYGYSTLKAYMADRYEMTGGSDQAIAAALVDFMMRFPVGQHREFDGKLYEIANVTTMRAIFQKLWTRPQALMIYAPPGSGKSEVSDWLIAEHNKSVLADKNNRQHIFSIYCRQNIRPGDLIRRVAIACGTPSRGGIEAVLNNLRFDHRRTRTILYFDEAQHLSIDCFETVRELLDRDPHFSLCFAGSHELEKTFNRFAGTLEQLNRRITDKVMLPEVSRAEARMIAEQELAELLQSVDAKKAKDRIERLIDTSTVAVVVGRKTQDYISIGRLMGSIREVRELSQEAVA